MVPADVFVASSDRDVEGWHLGGYTADAFTLHSRGAMPVQHSNTSSSVEGGTLVFRLTNVVVADVGSVNLLFARQASSSFPSYHGSGPDNRLSLSLDLLTGRVT